MSAFAQTQSPRLAARAIIMHDDRLLLVNAWAGTQSDLWCAPGGGVERGSSLHANLAREVHEETGLTVAVGAPCLINEYHDPTRDFHQVEIFFRCQITAGTLRDDWQDPENVVHSRRFFARSDMADLRFKPSSLADVVWGDTALTYDPLELLAK